MFSSRLLIDSVRLGIMDMMLTTWPSMCARSASTAPRVPSAVASTLQFPIENVVRSVGGGLIAWPWVRSHRAVSIGADPLRVELGVGKAEKVGAVEILCPGSCNRQSVRDLKLDHAYVVREGAAEAETIVLKSFRFPKADPHAHHHQ